MKQELQEKSYASSLDAIIARLQARRQSLDERHLLIVPDIYTFALERRLFSSGVGSFDVEVTTFNRLHKRLDSSKAALSKQSAIMLLKRICAEKASELSCYTRSYRRSGFAVKLYDTITKLRSCSVTPDELMTAAKLPKAKDVAILYAEYLKRTEGLYVDAGGRMGLLREYFENSDYLSNCHVYVALYDTFTSEIKKLLNVIERKALSLTVATHLPFEGYKITAPCVIACGVDRVSQYKLIAKKIKEYVLVEGNRYGDVCVVDESTNFSIPRRVFSEYGIPYYANERMSLGDTELARFIFAAIDAKRKGYRYDDMLALAANWYSACGKEESDAFATYCRKRCVDYVGFLKEFDGYEPECEQAEAVRKRLLKLIAPITVTNNAAQFFDGIKELLNRSDAEKRTQLLVEKDGRDIGGIYAKVTEVIENARTLYENSEESAEELALVLEEGLVGTSIALVPNENDTVQIGALAQFRGQRPRLAVIVDFNDGVLPVVAHDDGLITDADADKLEKYEMRVVPRQTEKNATCRDELWQFLKSAQSLFITYSEAEGSKPSYELRLLSRANEIKIHSSADVEFAIKAETNAQKIAASLGSVAGATELILIGEDVPYVESIRKAVGTENLPKKRVEKAFSEEAKHIFTKSNVTSVSALQTYFDCPFKYFMSYVLYIKKAQDGKIEPVDVGLFLHKMVEKYVEEYMPADIVEFVDKQAPLILDQLEKYRYKSNERIFLRLKDEAVKLCEIVVEQLAAGAFSPKITESSFGKSDSDLETITFPSGVKLVGEIDRVDVYGDYARVIDYKTGRAKFDYNDLYFGRKIQLMIYMQIMRKNGYFPAGAFYFPTAMSWDDGEYSHRLNGPFNAMEKLLWAEDSKLLYATKSTVIELTTRYDKNKKLSYYKTKLACNEGELKKLCDYAQAVAECAVDEIRRGNVKPSPAMLDRGSVCKYCEYAAVCGGGAGKERYTLGADKQNAIVEDSE